MQATALLPTSYEQTSTINFAKNKPLLISLTALSSVLFFAFGLLFLALASYLSPPFNHVQFTLALPGMIGALFVVVIVTFLNMILHELLHGLFFWIFTHTRPTFGFKGLYAFAAAPDWYIPRNPFVVIGLAPLLVISLVGLAVVPFVPFPVALSLVFAMTINAAGAIGDMYMVGLLLTKPSNILIRDFGDGITMYRPKQEHGIGMEETST